MRLPWGDLGYIRSLFFSDKDLFILGTISSEERCCAVPELLFSRGHCHIQLVEIRDPDDAFPNYSAEILEKVEQNRKRLHKSGVVFDSQVTRLLASHDQILSVINGCEHHRNSCFILDISSMPKRYFCLLLKRMILSSSFRNVVVTYTQAGKDGYTIEHLAEDPMTCDYIPGFSAPLPPEGDTLVLSLGYESLGIRSLLEAYCEKRSAAKVILAFPPNRESVRRQWRTLMELVSGDPTEISSSRLKTIPLWDVEGIYVTLNLWNEDANGLALAPFGPKPHALGMTLFAVKNDCGLYYTQPKSYNPNYTRGRGNSWAYVVKWDGIPCFDRPVKGL